MTRSLDRGLRIVEVLVQAEEPRGVSDLARILRIDKATVHRLLKVLCERGLVQRDSTSRRYACTTRILELSARLLAQMDLPQRARPHLRALVERTGQSAHLAVLARSTLQWAVYVADERSASHVQVDVRVGQMAPTYCTAVGKALIAYAPESALQALSLTGTLQQYTSKTITDIDVLVTHLTQVRGRGYAVDDEEFHVNIRCVGAPVRDGTGKVVASLGISGVAIELPKHSLHRKARVVMDLAQELSTTLGFSDLAKISEASI
jgi:IclR family KDG regulon transcriptional repressor